jgi:hypothetical protein
MAQWFSGMGYGKIGLMIKLGIEPPQVVRIQSLDTNHCTVFPQNPDHPYKQVSYFGELHPI